MDDVTYQELLKEYVNEKKDLLDKVNIIKSDNNYTSDKFKNFANVNLKLTTLTI